jgi:hypothetical protein
MPTDAPAPPTLPPGETDPNLLYIAVGRAIHAWEQMEEALASLYARFTGLPERPDALVDYGSENRRFQDRLAALRKAGDAYFISHANQDHEGEFERILSLAAELAIKRHRIAHGHISMWGEMRLPDQRGYFEITMTLLYRWAAPWYSIGSLRTNPVGVNAAAINDDHDEFGTLTNRIAALASALKPSCGSP